MEARTFGPNETVDFVVVGSGAAGGVMARELAQAGFEVLVLEQGSRFTAADFKHDELDTWFNNALLNNPEILPGDHPSRGSHDRPTRPRIHPRGTLLDRLHGTLGIGLVPCRPKHPLKLVAA